MKTRRQVQAAATLALLVAAAAAQAQGPAEAQSLQAQSALSARYTQLWSQMPAAQRPAFARAERHWLHVQRWEEQRRCEAQSTAAADGATEVAARCLAEVTLRRLQALPPPTLAAR